jgi:septal ring factor EnvC (AmiA/AmiB activator)
VLEAYELSRQEEARWREAKQRRLQDQISRLDDQEQRIRAEIKDLDGNLNRIRVASRAQAPGPKLQLSEMGASIYCAL